MYWTDTLANQVIESQELFIPFMVNGQVMNFKLICTKCGSTFFILADDYQTIRCEKENCDAIPLVVPNGFDKLLPGGMWKI